MPKSRHHPKRRAGTKKRGLLGGLAYRSRVSPSLSQVKLQNPISKSPVPMKVSKPVTPVTPGPSPVNPVTRQLPVNPVTPGPSPVNPVPRPVVPSNKSFKNTMQGHLNTATSAATNAGKKLLSNATAALSNLMGNARKAASSGGRKSRRRRTQKRRRSSRGFKKGTRSKTHRGRKNFTTKRGNKVFHRRGHYVRLNRAPYRKKK